MSREYNVQNRTRNRLAELNKRVSNKKSRYRRDKGIELNPLIQTMKPSDFTSAKEVQKYIKEMERFVSRKTQFVETDKGKIFERDAVQKFERNMRKINEVKRKKREQVAEIETQILGKKLGTTVGETMKLSPSTLFPNLAPLDINLNRFSNTKEMMDYLKDVLRKDYKGDFLFNENREYKRRFLLSLETVFGEKAQDLQNKINRMSVNDFMSIYYATTKSIDINYVYDDSEEKNKRLKTLYNTFGFKIPKSMED